MTTPIFRVITALKCPCEACDICSGEPLEEPLTTDCISLRSAFEAFLVDLDSSYGLGCSSYPWAPGSSIYRTGIVWKTTPCGDLTDKEVSLHFYGVTPASQMRIIRLLEARYE